MWEPSQGPALNMMWGRPSARPWVRNEHFYIQSVRFGGYLLQQHNLAYVILCITFPKQHWKRFHTVLQLPFWIRELQRKYQCILTCTLSYEERAREALLTEWKKTNASANATEAMWSLTKGKEDRCFGNHKVLHVTIKWTWIPRMRGKSILWFLWIQMCVLIYDSFITGVHT